MNILLKTIAILSLLISNTFAGTTDPLTPDEMYVVYGLKFHYIYRLCGINESKNMFCASAVAIDPHWALTAAHVVSDANTCGLIKGENKAYPVKEIFFHPEFKTEKFGYGDIALVRIDEDLGLDFYPELYEGEDEVGKVCSMSGYGMHGTFLTGQILSDGKRRAGSNIIDHIDRNLLICSPSKTKGRTELEFLIASGDSGGGLFIDGKLAGIHSCVLASDKNPNSNYTDESGHTRVSKYIKWIRQVMKQKSK